MRRIMHAEDAGEALSDLEEVRAEVHPLLRRDFKLALVSVIALQEKLAKAEAERDALLAAVREYIAAGDERSAELFATMEEIAPLVEAKKVTVQDAMARIDASSSGAKRQRMEAAFKSLRAIAGKGE